MKLLEWMKKRKERKIKKSGQSGRREAENMPILDAQSGAESFESEKPDILSSEAENAAESQIEGHGAEEYELPEETKAEIAMMLNNNENLRYIGRMTGHSEDYVKKYIRNNAEWCQYGGTQALKSIANNIRTVLYMCGKIEQITRRIDGLLKAEPGREPGELQESLAYVAGCGLPENTKESIREWCGYYRQKTIMSNNARKRHGLPMARRPKQRKRKKRAQ